MIRLVDREGKTVYQAGYQGGWPPPQVLRTATGAETSITVVLGVDLTEAEIEVIRKAPNLTLRVWDRVSYSDSKPRKNYVPGGLYRERRPS